MRVALYARVSTRDKDQNPERSATSPDSGFDFDAITGPTLLVR